MDKPDYLDEADEDGFARLVEATRKRRPAAAPVRAAAPAAPPHDTAKVELQSAASIVPQAIEWLWPGWLARGRLHLLAGQPGAGKTTLALEFAAIISSGGVWPDGLGMKQASVVIWSGEDGTADTLVPRLIAGGADLRRVHFMRGAREDGRPRGFDPARDMSALEKEVQRVGDVALVVIDPVALIATKDSHKNAETRRDLQPLADLCRVTGAAALGVHHLAKGTAGREPQERLIGSIAFAAVARVVMIAAKQPAQEGGTLERRILIRAKSNIGPDGGGFVYRLEQAALKQHPEIFTSHVVWGEPIEGSARDALAEAEHSHQEREMPLDEAKGFLRELLAAGPVASNEVKSAAEANGLSWASVRRAKKALGIKAHKEALRDGWSWSLSGGKGLSIPEEAQPFALSPFGRFEPLRDNPNSNNLGEEIEF
jgi:putative DNA primase/helicase